MDNDKITLNVIFSYIVIIDSDIFDSRVDPIIFNNKNYGL